MSPRVTGAVALRVGRQLRHDPRTIGLLLFIPVFLMVLLRYVLDDEGAFERIGIPILGVFPFITMFLATSITMLRERTTGTLERLMTLPLAKLDLLAGYALVFGIVAAVQASLVSLVGFTWLGLDSSHSPLLIVAVAIANGVRGMALGRFVSAVATSARVAGPSPATVNSDTCSPSRTIPARSRCRPASATPGAHPAVVTRAVRQTTPARIATSNGLAIGTTLFTATDATAAARQAASPGATARRKFTALPCAGSAARR